MFLERQVIFTKLSQYYDLFISSASFLCGGILVFEGWRLDPILLLSQILSTGIASFFLIETLFLRNIQKTSNKLPIQRVGHTIVCISKGTRFYQEYKLNSSQFIKNPKKVMYYNSLVEYRNGTSRNFK